MYMKIGYLEERLLPAVMRVAFARRARRRVSNADDKIGHLFPESYGKTVESC